MSEKPKVRRREGKFVREDNGLKLTTFKAIPPINQKNYYTEYLKRDSQLLVNLPRKGETPAPETASTKDEPLDDDEEMIKTIVIHPGSQNLRLGLATSFAPVVVPMAYARRIDEGKMEIDSELDPTQEEYEASYTKVRQDFKERMKFYKRRIVGNGDDIVRSFNGRQEGEKQLDEDKSWTADQKLVFGSQALELDDTYEVVWPLLNGELNEGEYRSPEELRTDLYRIINAAVENNLEIPASQFKQYSVVLLIPDLYDRNYVEVFVELLTGEMGFTKISLLQESVAATFGAGISSACIVDVGAQTTKVTCVDEGMAIADSRVNLKFGGKDITKTLARMLSDHQFPHHVDLSKMWDFNLIEWIKQKYCTCNDAEMAVQLYSFYSRQPNQPALKYNFKTFDEVMLPILGLFYPELFGHRHKLEGRHKLFPVPENIYDGTPANPISDAMINISLKTLAVFGERYQEKIARELAEKEATADVKKEETAEIKEDTVGIDDTASVANSASRSGTPAAETGQAKAAALKAMIQQQVKTQMEVFQAIDPQKVLLAPLDHAIIESIAQAAARTGTAPATYYENIMVIGGGANFPGFHVLLTDRLSMWNQKKDVGDIAVMAMPREMEPDNVVWKGGSVFAKLKIIDELWVTLDDWQILGSRVLQYKTLFAY